VNMVQWRYVKRMKQEFASPFAIFYNNPTYTVATYG
jgi:hypothetical protein